MIDNNYNSIATSGWGYVGSGGGSGGGSGAVILGTSYVSDGMENIVKSLLLMNKMLQYFKNNIQDEQFLNMLEEFNDNLSCYIEEEPKKEQVEEIFTL